MKIVFLSKKACADLMEKGDLLADFQLTIPNDIDPDLKTKDFCEFYGKFIIEEVPDQNLKNFNYKKEATKGIIVISRYNLENNILRIIADWEIKIPNEDYLKVIINHFIAPEEVKS